MDAVTHPNFHVSFSQPPLTESGSSLRSTDVFGIVFFVIIGVFGIIGNSLVMVIFGLLTQQKSQVNMFIFDQALIDCLTSVLLILYGVLNALRPQIMAYEYDSVPGRNSTVSEDLGHYVHLSPATADFLCRFWWSRFFLFSCFDISSWNLTVMSIERYFAVLHPTTYSRNFSKRRALIMIILIWICAPIMQYFPPIFQHTSGPEMCINKDSWTSVAGTLTGIALFLWAYVIPVATMAYVYININRELRKKKRALAVTKPLDPSSASNTPTTPKRIIKGQGRAPKTHSPSMNITTTLCILFAVYVVCFTPNRVSFLQYNCGGPLNFTGVWYQFSVALAFINCCVNPFIYALRLKKFKEGMRMMLACQWHRPSAHDSKTKTVESSSL